MTIKKFRHLILTLFIALLVLPVTLPVAQANAGEMQWTVIDTPDGKDNVIVSPSEINFMSASQDGLIFFCSDVPHSKLYKSKDGGKSWADISSHLSSAGASLPPWNSAVAPDNPNIVAVVTSSGGLPQDIFLSYDGGNRWQNLNFPVAADICALDISPHYGNYDIAVGTRTATGAGKLFIFKMSNGIGSWADQGFTGDILSIKFSPNYSSDDSIAFVSADSSGSYINIAIRDTVANTSNFGSWAPVEITTKGAGTSPKATQLITADIELPADFLGQTGISRKIFISTFDGGATGNAGIFRVDDSLIYNIFQTSGSKMVSSISYSGTVSSGKLLAGEVRANAALASVDVWYCLNAADNCPLTACLIWQKASKPPTGGANSGNANAQVTWRRDGSRAFCGTGSADLTGSGWPDGYYISQTLDESAFSYSVDDGNTWNQISLIDTQINFLADFLPTYTSETIYLASINTGDGYNGFDSVWKYSNYQHSRLWERVLCILTNSNDTILRMNAIRSNEVFLGIRYTNNLWLSSDSGQTWRMISPNVNLTDFSVTEINTAPSIFVLDDTTVRRGEYTGIAWKWGQPVSTSLTSGHTITATPMGIILVGDRGQGSVAISLNAGASFGSLPALPVSGNVNVILNCRVRDPYLIHAATDNPSSGIYSWILGASAKWLDMSPPGQGYYGLVQPNTLYGCQSSGGTSSISRTLQPELLGPPFIEWATMTAGLDSGVVFTREPSALKISSGANLWAIDNRPYTATTGRLWQYCDCLSGAAVMINLPPEEILLQSPTPTSPAMDMLIQIDTSNNKIPAIEFQWQHITPAAGYDLVLATDKNFGEIILEKSINPDSVNSPSWVLPAEHTPLQTGKDYYWKVRINRIAYTYQRMQGQWSNTMRFSIMSSPSSKSEGAMIALLSPAGGEVITVVSPVFTWTTVAAIDRYELTMAKDFDMHQIIINTTTSEKRYQYAGTLEPGTTYYWQVKPVGLDEIQPSSVANFTVAADPESNTVKSMAIPMWLWILVSSLAVITTITLVLVFSMKVKRDKS